jgi:AcrR family transcriptional regulator
VSEVRDQILESALRHFETQGYSGTSFRDIADDLGVTKAAIYYHFPSKTGLIDALVAPANEQMRSLRKTREVDRSSAGDVREAMRLYLRVYIDHRRVMTWLTNDVSAEIERRAHETLRRRWRDILLPANPTKDQVLRANCAVLLLHYPVWSRWHDGDEDRLLDVALDVLGVDRVKPKKATAKTEGPSRKRTASRRES